MSSGERKPPRAGSKRASPPKEGRSSTPSIVRTTSARQANTNDETDKPLAEDFARQLELAATELQKGKQTFLERMGHPVPPTDSLPPRGSSSSSSGNLRMQKARLEALTAECRTVASLLDRRNPSVDPEPERALRVPYTRSITSILQKHPDPRQALPRLERALQPYLLVRGERGADGLNDEMIRQHQHAIKAMQEEIADLYRVPQAGAAAAGESVKSERDLTLPISPKSWLAMARTRSGGDVMGARSPSGTGRSV